MRNVIDLPVIEDHKGGFAAFHIKYGLIGSISLNTNVNAWAIHFIRLTDSALQEYNLGAEHLLEFNANRRDNFMVSVLRSASHFEHCITSLHRAVLHLQMLLQESKDSSVASFLREHAPAVASDADAKAKLRKFRHFIHHVDERLLHGKIKEGQWIALRPNGPTIPDPERDGDFIKVFDRLSINNEDILFRDLAKWLQEMATTAQALADLDPWPAALRSASANADT